MRLVFVGPALRDDPAIYALTHTRAAIARGDEVVDAVIRAVSEEEEGKNLLKGEIVFNAARYRKMILNVANKQGEEIEGSTVIIPVADKAENEILDGQYEGVREYHDVYLPNLRSRIRDACSTTGEVLVHIDLGDCLGTLYAAYFAIADGFSTSVTFHKPNDPEASFAIGGHSDYGKFRPNLRRKLGSLVIQGAERVFVSEEAVAGALSTLFNFDMRYFGDPLTDQHVTPEPEPLPSREGDSDA